MMAAQLELFLQAEMRISSGRLFSYGEDSSESSPQIVRKSLQRGGIRTSKILEPHNTALHAYGPKPEPSIPTLRHQTRGEIMGLYGVPEALYFADAGAAAREALRAFADVTLPEYASVLEEELTEKLETEIRLDFSRLAVADIVGRARAYAQLVGAGLAAEMAAEQTGIKTR